MFLFRTLFPPFFIVFLLMSFAAFAQDIPPQAEEVGYVVNTYSSRICEKNVDLKKTLRSGFDWYLWNFWSKQSEKSVISFLPHKIASVIGDTKGFNGQIATAAITKSQAGFVGVAFGGGAYFEAELAFDPDAVDKGGASEGWPSFWTMPIEVLTRRKELSQWPGQERGYEQYIEIDFMEYGFAFNGKPSNFYGTDLHHFYGRFAKTCSTAFCNYSRPRSDMKTKVPADTDFNEFHKYGYLWVPATKYNLGYGQSYFDGMPVGKPVMWIREPKVTNPPPRGLWAYSLIDRQHHVLVLGSGRQAPILIKSVNVWQNNSDSNWVE